MAIRREWWFRHVAAVLAVLWTTATLGAPVWAQERESPSETGEERGSAKGKQLLAEGIRLYEELEWDAAEQTLVQALDAGLSRADRAVAYWHLAILARARDRMDEAEEYLYETLRANPRFQLPQELLGTDFEDLFRRAVARMDRTPPSIRILPLEDVAEGKPVTVTVEVSDDSAIASVDLVFSLPGARGETEITMRPVAKGRWQAELPATAMREGRLVTFQVRATDEWWNVGTQSATVSVPKAGGGRGWLWLVGSLFAAAAGSAAYFLGVFAGEEQPPPTGGETPAIWPTSQPPGPPNP